MLPRAVMPVHGTGRVRWLLLVGVPAAASELPAGAFGGRAELQAAPNPAARASGGLMHNPPSSAAKPHIVALIADDLGWANVGYHSAEVSTPTIDALVAMAGVCRHMHTTYAHRAASPS